MARSHPPDDHRAEQARWADVIPLPEGRAALSVGVVDAEGRQARLLTDRLRAAGRACTDQELLTAAALSTLDAVLQELAADTRATAV